MGNRYYNFFALLRQAQRTRKLEFLAPGNKLINQVLTILREKGLIAGFNLDSSCWKGYPNYKVFLKYNYLGVPCIKKLSCYKLTKTNFTKFSEEKKSLNQNYWLVTNSNKRVYLVTTRELLVNSLILAKIKI